MLVNDKLVCSSNATYGGDSSTAVVGGKEWQTITKMSECFNPVQVKKGDIIKVSALYDTKAHPL